MGLPLAAFADEHKGPTLRRTDGLQRLENVPRGIGDSEEVLGPDLGGPGPIPVRQFDRRAFQPSPLEFLAKGQSQHGSLLSSRVPWSSRPLGSTRAFVRSLDLDVPGHGLPLSGDWARHVGMRIQRKRATGNIQASPGPPPCQLRRGCNRRLPGMVTVATRPRTIRRNDLSEGLLPAILEEYLLCQRMGGLDVPQFCAQRFGLQGETTSAWGRVLDLTGRHIPKNVAGVEEASLFRPPEMLLMAQFPSPPPGSPRESGASPTKAGP